MKQFVDYWQCAAQLQSLYDLSLQQLPNHYRFVARAECAAGKFADQAVIDQLRAKNATIVLAPYYALLRDKCFFPCLLIADLTVEGELIAKAHLSLPIIPRTVLEPAPLRPISLGFAERFDDYISMHPPEWLENDVVPTWHEQLQYAQSLLAAVTPTWQEDLLVNEYVIQQDVLIFPLPCQPQLQIAELPEDITLVNAALGAATSTYASQLIIDAWINSAVYQTAPPRYVLLQPNKNPSYTTILDHYPSDIVLDFANHNQLHTQLAAKHANYMYGQQLLRNWQELTERSRAKNVDQLQVNLKSAKNQIKNLQVLSSIWQRQKELLVVWPQLLDFIPFVQKRRLQRLYEFFKQNFPNDVVDGLTLLQLDDLLAEKMRKVETTARVLADSLHQIENDIYQENLVRDKCLQWCAEQRIFFDKIDEILAFMQGTMWREISALSKVYWQEYFACNKQEYIEFIQKKPKKIDVLIVEHAEYIAPIYAAELLSISDKVVVIGNYNAITNQRFPVQVDYELAKHFGLAEDDIGFEDLQFAGVLVSTGNMWSMVADGREADHNLISAATNMLEYQYIDVQTHSAMHAGSMVNMGVTKVVLAWLQENRECIDDLAIYTCFSAQANDIQIALADTMFSTVPVLFIQQPTVEQYKISLFLPVYTQRDPRPYIFDRGCEMFDQLIANTKQRLIVIGDMRIFKPELHSASGKLAKLLFNKIEEVGSVGVPI